MQTQPHVSPNPEPKGFFKRNALRSLLYSRTGDVFLFFVYLRLHSLICTTHDLVKPQAAGEYRPRK